MARWILDRGAQAGSPSTGTRRALADGAACPAEALVAQAAACGAVDAVADRGRAADGPSGSARGRLDGEPSVAPAPPGTVVGIAGASGKSAVAAFLRGIGRAEGLAVGSAGAATWFDGDSIRPVGSPGDDHDRLPLAAMLAGMARQGCDSAVLELGRAAIDRRDLDGVGLTAAVVTDLGEDDRPGRRRACARLIRQVEAGGSVVIDADDPEADVLGAVNLGARRVTFAVVDGAAGAQPASVSAVIERLDAGSCRFRLLGFGQDATVTLGVGGGRATVRRAVAAAAVAWSLGIPAEVVVRGLESVARGPGRPDPTRAGQPFEVRVDRARRGGDLTRALAQLRASTPGRVICVAGAEGAVLGDPAPALREAERAAIGRAAELGADRVILTAAGPGAEDPNAIVDEVLAGMIRPGRARVELDRRAAIALALAEARPGDGVLIVVPLDGSPIAGPILRDRSPAASRASA